MNIIDEKIHNRILEKKKELDKYRPLSNDLVKKLHERMEIEYTYHSNAIEGNTLNYRETQLVIREGITISGKSLKEHLEAKNHPYAIEYIETLKDSSIKEKDILKCHEILFSGILENAGNYRSSQVFIEGSDYIPPPAFEVPELMEDLIKNIEKNLMEFRPIELASFLHQRLVHIHPFDDGNGRVSRLFMNLILIKYGYVVTPIKTYDCRRYYDALKKADNGNLKPFVNFVARCVDSTLNLYLSVVKREEKNQLMKLRDIAKRTPYSKGYLSLLARKGRISATKIGKDWYMTEEALDNYVNSVRSC